MNKQKVIFRTDGNGTIGLGHITRCCALADMLREKFDTYFYIRDPAQEIIGEVQQHCISIHTIDAGLSFAKESGDWIKSLKGDEIVILDGYNFTTDYQLSIKARGCRLVCIDDIYAYHFVSDVLINHAGGAQAKEYSTAPYTKKLLGFKYALLREPFLDRSDMAGNAVGPEELLICFGGADQGNHTVRTLERISGIYNGKINIIIGSAYRHVTELKDFVKKYNNREISIYRNIDASELATIMKRSLFAICSPSTVSIEYLSIANGTLYLEVIADNQERMFEFLVSEFLAFPLEHLISGKKTAHNHPLRNYLFDGLQKQRYLEIFNNL
jgi:UDP-2,4-diacetamido-2,4,6-trideoxy-beta-L-altropyranose hydrolase